jgi:hypothetical protein
MALSSDEMIAALDAFEAVSGYDENQSELYEIVDGFGSLADRARVIPAMFSLMERFPEAYLGTPGPLVHSIESLGINRYEPLLIESVKRQPTELGVWMLNRILNIALPGEHRERLLELMRSAGRHPKCPARVAGLAEQFLEYQAGREVR